MNLPLRIYSYCYISLDHSLTTPMQLLPGQTTTHTTSITNTAAQPTAPSAPALVDTLRAGGPVGHASTLNGRHPLEARLAHWDAQQEEMHMATRRRLHGVADPMRREMELHLVSLTEQRPLLLGGSSHIHADVLRGRDWSIDWEDIYPDTVDTAADTTVEGSLHAAMEKALHLN